MHTHVTSVHITEDHWCTETFLGLDDMNDTNIHRATLTHCQMTII